MTKTVRINNKKVDVYLIILDCLSGKIINEELNKEKTIIPNLKGFANKYTFYPNCFSPGTWTPPSHASLFTGLHLSEHKVDGYKLFAPRGFTTIASMLNDINYETYGFFANGYFDKFFGLGEGFKNMPVFWNKDKPFVDIKTKLNIKRPFSSVKKYGIAKYLEVFFAKVINSIYKILTDSRSVRRKSRLSTKKIIKRTIKTIEKRDKPKFVCINLMEVHRDFNPPDWVKKKFNLHSMDIEQNPTSYLAGKNHISEKEFIDLKKYYKAEIFYLDYELKALLEKLNQEDNALVVITADHGLHIGERKSSKLKEKALFDIPFSIYNELTKVPFIVKFPKGFCDSKNKDRIVQSHDIFNTICDLTGLYNKKTVSSRSLLSEKKRDFAKSELISTDYQTEGVRKYNKDFGKLELEQYLIQRKTAIVTENLKKYIVCENGEVEIYDLNNDPDEQKNLFEPEDGIPDFIKEKIDYVYNVRNKTVPREENDNKEVIKNRLKELGYM